MRAGARVSTGKLLSYLPDCLWSTNPSLWRLCPERFGRQVPMSEARDSRSIDFVAAWKSDLLMRSGARLDRQTDLAFWEEYAPHYDERTALPGSYAQTLAVLETLVRPQDSVLDVGAGTGRFALPLAKLVRHITALDHAPAMLRILHAKAAAAGIDNITLIEAAWETASIRPHDVVLAAWSLYRQTELGETLAKLIAASGRVLIIAAPDDFEPPHRALVREIWGGDYEPDVPAYLYLLGALRQIGVRADLRMVEETRCFHQSTALDLAKQLAPLSATGAELDGFLRRMGRLLRMSADGWEYCYTVSAGIIIWQRCTEGSAL
jgi:protein-L-isoaspartate O-methyltransferase